MRKYLITLFAVAAAAIAMAAGTRVWMYSHSGNHKYLDLVDFDSLSFVEPGFLEINPVEKRIGKEGGRFTLEITANKPWTATSNDPAVILGTTQGSGNAKISCTAMPNAEQETYIAIITVTLEDNTYKQVLVTVGEDESKIKSISFKENSYTIREDYMGLNLRKELVVAPEGIIDTCQITWRVDDLEIAEMDGSDVIPIRPGVTKVTASLQGVEASCYVTITEVPLESINLTDFTVSINETKKVPAATSPKEFPLERLNWSSSDKSVAIIDSKGQVTGIKEGSASITAQYGSSFKVSCTVAVRKVKVSSVTLSQSLIQFANVGETAILTVTILPDDASYKDVTWKSSDTSVATVDSNGVVTCKGVGTTIVTATADEKNAYCKVPVGIYGTVIDACGNSYKTVIIGTQIWMAENMRCNKYDTQSERAGAIISTSNSRTYEPYYSDASNSNNWESQSDFSGNLSSEQIAKLGYHYNWAAAVGLTESTVRNQTSSFGGKRQGICPNGWHIPTVAEWKTLRNYIGFDETSNLKTSTGWYDGISDDLYSFEALPAGDVNFIKVSDVGREASFWTASPKNDCNAYYRNIYSSDYRIVENSHYKYYGHSIRCIKD